MSMKSLLCVLCLAAAESLLALERTVRLPRSEFADTEVTTNCPFNFGLHAVRRFCFDMTLVGTESNCVHLAFGRDANADGVLDADESRLTFAWDCGRWRLVSPADGLDCSWAAQTTNSVKDFRWDLRTSHRRARCLELSENGVPVDCVLPDPDVLFDPEWDVFRLTVRGVDPPEEEVCVILDQSGYVIEVR